MIRFTLLAFIFLPVLLTAQEVVSWKSYEDVLKNINAPTFPNKEFVITKYGAKADGKTLCTKAIEKAINDCNKAGGGKVIVPEGIFLTGAIHLKSNVNLVVSEKATLLFSKEYKDYLPNVITRFEGNELMNYSPFIYAYGQENIAISGTGTIDGNADTTTWWFWTGSKKDGWKEGMPNQKEDRKKLFEYSDNRIPVEQRIFGEGHFMRVNFIQFYNCKNILIEGITILRSPMWEINPVLSNNITVRKVHIVSHGANNDGCDPESCSNVLIDSCFFDTGDDCIAIKSGREEDGRRIAIASENIIVRNSEMKDGHGGVVIGSEISGDCRNVFIENCKMSSPNLDRALRIKSNGVRGGTVENIFMRNCQVGEVAEAVIYADLFYEKVSTGPYTPIVRNVYVENVTSQKSPYAVWLKGYENSPVSNVVIKNCKFNGVEKGNNMLNTKNIIFDNVFINNELAK